MRRAGGSACLRGACAVLAAFLGVVVDAGWGARPGAGVSMALGGGDARAQAGGGEHPEGPPPIAPEEIGTWRFRDPGRPHKAVVIGGSVSAWPRGGYSQFLEAACPRVEIVNKGKARIGARQLRERFTKQVLRNARVRAQRGDFASFTLIFHGGLNSVGTPGLTNEQIRKTFVAAHKHHMRVIALSLNPWGSPRRWRGAKGLRSFWHTRQAVDFVLGKLSPAEALGRYARGRSQPGWVAGELPDVGVDLYDSPLRDASAPLLAAAPVTRALRVDKKLRRRLAAVPEGEREATFAGWVETARSLPRWWMRRELRGFDDIHPNLEGHRVIAELMCPKLPPEWACQCEALAKMQWYSKRGGLAPRVP